jgi:ribonuclease HI
MLNQTYILNSDGGARGNPGPAAIGYVIHNQKGEVVEKFGKTIGQTTNNQAEYKALIAGLESALSLGVEKIICLLDSELIVNQMKGKYKIKEPGLKVLASDVLRLTAKFKAMDFQHVPREKNQLADELVNQALDAEIKK